MFTYKLCHPVTSVLCEMTQGFAGSFMLTINAEAANRDRTSVCIFTTLSTRLLSDGDRHRHM